MDDGMQKVPGVSESYCCPVPSKDKWLYCPQFEDNTRKMTCLNDNSCKRLSEVEKLGTCASQTTTHVESCATQSNNGRAMCVGHSSMCKWYAANVPASHIPEPYYVGASGILSKNITLVNNTHSMTSTEKFHTNCTSNDTYTDSTGAQRRYCENQTWKNPPSTDVTYVCPAGKRVGCNRVRRYHGDRVGVGAHSLHCEYMYCY